MAENSFIIVYVGRIEDRKGYGFLMQIWKRYFQGNKDYTLLICGGKKKNLNHPNIKYLGFVDNIPEVLSISNCLLLPSKHEGLPYAVLESLASGCPIIASKIPGISSIIKNNLNGILVKDFNIHKYYQKLTKLKTDSNFKIKLIKNGLVTSKNYDRTDFLKAYTNLFKSLISKKTN